MARKSDRNKSKKSPEKSPRRGGRSSRRRKKSDSVSSDDQSKDRKDKEQVPQEIESTSQNSEASGDGDGLNERARRSARRGQSTTVSAPEPSVPAASEEWVEDKQFWGAEETSQPKEGGGAAGEEGEKAGTEKEEGCEWKVQTSNGKGGVIQKLRICRTRLTGSESASELSPSPGKESPISKRKGSEGEGNESESSDPPRLRLKLKTVKNRSSSDPEQPPVSGSEDETSKVKSSSCSEVPDSPVTHNVIVEHVADISLPEGSEPTEENRVNDLRDAELAAAVSSIIGVSPTFSSSSSADKENVKTTSSNQGVKIEAKDQKLEVEEKRKSEEENTEEEPVELKVANEKKSETSSESPEKMDSEKTEKSSETKDKDETMDADDMDNVSRRSSEDGADEGVEINISPEEIEAATGGLDETTPLKVPRGIGKVDLKKKSQDTKSSTKKASSPDEYASKKKDKDGEKDGKVNLRRSSTKDSVENAVKKSSEDDSYQSEGDQKEEGEIDTEQEETPKRTVRTNRSLSTASNTSQDSSGNSKSLATTARNHPLITGPDPDTEVKIKRPRKISVVSPATPRTSTSGRQVRSIAGDALKSILPAVSAEIEKKESEKQAARDKILKVRSEKQQQVTKKSDSSVQKSSGKTSKASAKLPDLEGKMVVTVVDDVREVVNRLKEEKKEEKKSKSNSENLEPKVAKLVRKVVLASSAAPEELEVKAAKPVRAASPGDSAATQVLFVTNLVRPFTANQLRDLLARTGTIAKDGFFIDKIKSKCYVKFTDVEMAIETRHALDGVRWPASNPKTLRVHYVSESEMENAVSDADRDVQWLSGHALVNDHISRVSVGGVREWDVGKVGGHEEEAPLDKWRQDLRESRRETDVRVEEPRREEPRRDESRRQDARLDLFQRKRAFSPEKPNAVEPARKFKRKDHDGPAKLLDDLFRKTKATPCLYWLPLSSAQIAVKEEMRRKHMAEHKRRIELEKLEHARREKERERRRK